jgi:hypothetical protein
MTPSRIDAPWVDSLAAALVTHTQLNISCCNGLSDVFLAADVVDVR